MIIRILGEGQWQVEDSVLSSLNELDDAVEQAVAADDEARLDEALHQLLDKVRTAGQVVPDDQLEDSDLILPSSDSTLAEVRELLSESDEGLVPN